MLHHTHAMSHMSVYNQGWLYPDYHHNNVRRSHGDPVSIHVHGHLAWISNSLRCFPCVHTRSVFHRSLNDKNKILLTSFFMNDIPKILDQSRTKEKSKSKSARMYADISTFLEGVCKDIKIMYPSTNGDYQYVQRLFTRLMDTPTSSVKITPSVHAHGEASSDKKDHLDLVVPAQPDA